MATSRLLACSLSFVPCVSWSVDAHGQRGGRLRVLARGEVVDQHGRDEWEIVTSEPSARQRAQLGNDVSEAEYALINAEIEAYERAHRRLPTRRLEIPNRYVVYPNAGLHEGDMYFSNFVDLDPTVDALLDWDCTKYTYDGHRGIDSSPRSFGYQDAGVPVYAALDGRVISTHDGEPDHNTDSQDVPSNRIVIDHGGQDAIYGHLKKDSVTVAVGDNVVAGQQIAMIGSSGHSSNSHLHFETRVDDVPMEAFAGKCRSGKAAFTSQLKFKRRLYIIDAGITHVDIYGLPDSEQYPSQLPGGGQFQTDGAWIYHWMLIRNMPANSNWRLVFRRPDKKVARDTGDQSFGNAQFARRWTIRFRSLADGGARDYWHVEDRVLHQRKKAGDPAF